MCGITVVLFLKSQTEQLTRKLEYIHQTLNQRGPDSVGYEIIEINEDFLLLLLGSTLHIRGDSVTKQPLRDHQGNLLLWNGEIFTGISVSEKQNDGEVLLERLLSADGTCINDNSEHILKTFSSLHGPYAFVYWQNKTKQLWVGRDLFGRRSLLVSGSLLKNNNINNNRYLDNNNGIKNNLNNVKIKNTHSNDNETSNNYITKELNDKFSTAINTSVTCSNNNNDIKNEDNTNNTDTLSVKTSNKNSHHAKFPLIFSSVALGQLQDSWNELPAFGVYCFDLSNFIYPPFVPSFHSSINLVTSSNDLLKGQIVSRGSSNYKANSIDGDHSKCMELQNGDITMFTSNTYIPVTLYPWVWCDVDDDISNSVVDDDGVVEDYFNLDFSYLSFLTTKISKKRIKIPVKKPIFEESQKNSFFDSENNSAEYFELVAKELKNNKSSTQTTVVGEDQIGKLLRLLSCRLMLSELKEATDNFFEVLLKAVEVRVSEKNLPSLCLNCVKSQSNIQDVSSNIRKHLFSIRFSDCNKNTTSTNRNDMPKYTTSTTTTTENTNEVSPHECSHSKMAILFSGGIDSFILAYLTHRYAKEGVPIDLLNVSFHKDTTPRTPTPDRQTGIEAHDVLSRLCPSRIWNLVEIDVSQKELEEYRQTHIRNLIQPLDTVLDDSIGCALWFASRGVGHLRSLNGDPSKKVYTSPSQVVLSGLGADELLAGYSRHRKKFGSERNYNALYTEMLDDVKRLWSRNLGRDDRVISSHSREARFPFLDVYVVSFLFNLPMRFKFDLTLPRGAGDKAILRQLVAMFGEYKIALQAKRAIQFGSRIAKLETRKEKASDVCGRLAA